jgi:hypothetical protein
MKYCLLAIAAIASGRLAHAESRSAGPLEIVAPDAVLGRDTTIDLTMHTRADLRWVTSTGSLSEPSDGRVTLTLPAAKYPQLAIVAALDRSGTLVDWIAVPLAGRATIRVDTSPGADVAVDVAGVRTPVVRATAAGVAEVSIVVPPGVPEVRTIATTRGGATIEKTQSLGVPAVKSLLAACVADRVTAIATTSTGAPLDEPPAIATRSATLAPVAIARGIATATVTSAHPEATAAEIVTVTASIAGQDASCELMLQHEPPALPPPPPPPRIIAPRPRPAPRLQLVPRVGVLTNLGRITTPYASVSLGVRVSARIVIDASVGGYSSSIDAMTDAGERIDGRLTTLPGLVRVAYRHPLGPARLWLGAGAGVVTATSHVRSALGETRTTSIVPAATAAAGIGWHLGPGWLGAEAGYLHATVHDAVSGRAGGIVTSLGFGVDL